jgi:putative transposase
VLWVLARRFCGGWREQLSIVTPDTVVRWHRQGWRLFWRWTSRSRGGRPHLSPEARDLILTMSRENRLWGTERIRGELLKLGIVVSNRSIRRYRWRGPARSPNQTWRTFLHNHAHHLWAADLFTLPMLTFETLYVLVFIAHGRRELVYLNVTANPTAAWVWRQLVESTPGEASRAICSAIAIRSTAATFVNGPDESVSMPSLHPFGRRVRMRSPRESSAHSGESVWTT